jgi:hypothetical protein
MHEARRVPVIAWWDLLRRLLPMLFDVVNDLNPAQPAVGDPEQQLVVTVRVIPISRRSFRIVAIS